MRRLLAACAIGFIVSIVATSHSASAADFPSPDALILRLMSTDNVPGVALAFIKDGNIVLEKGYGFRDLATHASVTTATLFNIGSISKSFTALGIAQLVDLVGTENFTIAVYVVIALLAVAGAAAWLHFPRQ